MTLAELFNISYGSIVDLHMSPASRCQETRRGHRLYKYHGARRAELDKHDIKTTHVIHVRRNPLDVFLSYMNFSSDNVTRSAIIRFPSIEEIHETPLFDAYFKMFVLTGHLAKGAFPVITGDYFSHNQNWLERAGRNTSVQCLTYENLQSDPLRELAFITPWFGFDETEIETALSKANEKTPVNGRLFWKQKTKNFREYLSDEQIDFFLKYREEETSAIGYPREFFLGDEGPSV